jgi:hypothetical protein
MANAHRSALIERTGGWKSVPVSMHGWSCILDTPHLRLYEPNCGGFAKPYVGIEAYARAKLLNVMWTQALAERLAFGLRHQLPQKRTTLWLIAPSRLEPCSSGSGCLVEDASTLRMFPSSSTREAAGRGFRRGGEQS